MKVFYCSKQSRVITFCQALDEPPLLVCSNRDNAYEVLMKNLHFRRQLIKMEYHNLNYTGIGRIFHLGIDHATRDLYQLNKCYDTYLYKNNCSLWLPTPKSNFGGSKINHPYFFGKGEFPLNSGPNKIKSALSNSNKKNSCQIL